VSSKIKNQIGRDILAKLTVHCLPLGRCCHNNRRCHRSAEVMQSEKGHNSIFLFLIYIDILIERGIRQFSDLRILIDNTRELTHKVHNPFDNCCCKRSRETIASFHSLRIDCSLLIKLIDQKYFRHSQSPLRRHYSHLSREKYGVCGGVAEIFAFFSSPPLLRLASNSPQTTSPSSKYRPCRVKSTEETMCACWIRVVVCMHFFCTE
jgi:hypothetical protein